jgi:sugar O-acyltransferase (sialic acid O-acetyltransferase NeuD family)
MRVLIIGAGGHAQVVADILLRRYEQGAGIRPVGYLDDNPHLFGKELLGLPVLGVVASCSAISHDAVIIAIGENHIRARIFHLLKQHGERFVNAIHPAAVVAPDVHLGEGVVICAGTVVNPCAAISDNVILNTCCSVDHHGNIEEHVHIAPGTHLGGNVHIETGAFIGIGSAVIPRRCIGQWAVVGAGAAVTTDIPAYATAVGVPARVIKKREAEDGNCKV